MFTHLFITGPVQSGKSSLLLDAIYPYADEIGGFISQRLKDKQGNTIGFRLADFADSPSLSAPYADQEDLFLKFGEDRHINLSVFHDTGTAILKKAAKEKPIILLDEIGGIELLSPAFQKTLLKVLEIRPCIGIFKLPAYAGSMSEAVKEENRKLYNKIFNGNALRIDYDREGYARQKRIIEDFILSSM